MRARAINSNLNSHYIIKKKSDKSKIKDNNNMIKFYSREKLLTLDLQAHAERIFQNIHSKEQFIKLLSDHFCYNSNVDCQVFSNKTFQAFAEKSFIKEILPYNLSQLRGLRIAAVDGGLGIKRYIGFQLTMIKVAVVAYEFNSSENPTIRNFPPLKHNENYSLFTDHGNFYENSGNLLSGLRRALSENTMLIQYLKSEPELPDLVILDGSILPPPEPRIFHNRKLVQDIFTACRESYLKLYKLCDSKDILLVGSVKDSNSTVLRDLLVRAFPSYLSKFKSMNLLQKLNYRQYFKKFSDIELLYKIMKPKQRSLAFRYDLARKKNENKNDNSNKNNNNLKNSINENQFEKYPIYASYLQISPFDMPLRVEFLGQRDISKVSKRLNMIVNILYPLSSINSTCTLPLPQIEAHLRANLPMKEFEIVAQQLETNFKIMQIAQLPNKNNYQNKKLKKNENISLDLPIKSFYSTFLRKRHDRMDNLF